MLLSHVRDDYLELLHLAGLAVGLDIQVSYIYRLKTCTVVTVSLSSFESYHVLFHVTIRRPGAIHRARWMAKAIYALKMELLLEGNQSVMCLSMKEIVAIQRFNCFVVTVYLQS